MALNSLSESILTTKGLLDFGLVILGPSHPKNSWSEDADAFSDNFLSFEVVSIFAFTDPSFLIEISTLYVTLDEFVEIE